MRTHTQAFKEGIKEYGRQFNDVLSFNDGQNNLILISKDKINRINYSVDTTLMKSVMQTMTIDINSNVDIDVYNKLQYGISLVGDNTNISFRYFNVTKKEEQKDKKSYIYTCQDNMIKAMVDYETPTVNGSVITYPITIRDYISAICSHLGLTFKNASDTFTNYNKQVTSEHYIDADGNKMGYTFRDVLDDIAEAVGGFICIDNNGQLEIRYISNAIGTKNIFNINDVTSVTNGTLNDGLITTTSTTATTYNINPSFSQKTLSAGKTYYMSADIRIVSGSGSFNKMNDSVANWTSVTKPTLSNTFQKYVYKTTLSNNRNYTKLLFQFSNVSSGVFEIKNIMISESEDTTYEPYGDTINEDYFSDKNVNIGKKVGAYNTLVLSRASDSDNIHRPTTLPANPVELKISDNAILEQDNREDFIDGIFNQINGLEFYLNDFATTGILYYEIGDKYNVSIDGTIYPCLMLSDDIKRTTGLKENIVTKEPKQSVTDYKYSSTTDKVEISSRNAKILVDKANASIEQIVEAVGDNGEVTTASIVQSINDSGSNIQLNADKVYINGVTFDENQKMTMTDGDIEIIDNGGQDLSDSHIIIKSVDDTKINYLTSYLSRHSYIVTENGINYRYGTNVEGTNIRVSKTNLDTNTLLDHTTLTPSYLFATLTENGHTSETIIGSKRILTRLDNTETFDLDTTTGNTTIGGTLNNKHPSNLLEKVYLGTGVDLNNYKESGHYGLYGNNTNCPTTSICTLEVIQYSVDWVVQIVTEVASGKKWQRSFTYGNTWGYWELLTQDYSTSEQIIGRYIDGKPIYRKVIDETLITNANSQRINHGISNLFQVITLKAYAKYGSTTFDLLSSGYIVRVDDTAFQFNMMSNGIGLNGYGVSVILEYTKTTD